MPYQPSLLPNTETYHTETREVLFQGKHIVLESMTPILTPKQREQRKRHVENMLFEVFHKYQSKQ